MLRVWDVKTVIHISKFYGRSLTYLLVFNCVGGLFKTNMMSVGQEALHGVTEDSLVCNHCTIFRAGCSAGGGAGAGRGRGRPPGLGLLPRQKSLDSSLAAAQINQMELLARTHAAGPVRGSATNLYHQ